MTSQKTDKKAQTNTQHDFSSLKAVYVNCTLKKSPDFSHTEGLMKVSENIMEKNGVETEMIRAIDHDIANGIYPDMTEHGWEKDAWPPLFKQIIKADILVLGTPIWLGDISSVCTKVIERFYAMSSKMNEKGQYIYYGKTAGCIITGNEDGIKHCSRSVLYALQHVGYTIPPQADAGWIGEAGPGPSYLDEGSGGPENDFTNRNVTFMTWNLMHMAQMMKVNGGMPAHGNQPEDWKNGKRFGFEKPQYK
ncbi:MAG: flavodoxin family protein [Bacteroidales bacterium]|nr:flavodoxin family protein [Bacteroidales bacterium]